MDKKQRIIKPVYQQIAIDLATKIVTGKYQVGQKLSGRSSLSSQYGVSPETIRKAVAILKDVEIVDTAQGSGIQILSSEKALAFIQQYEEIETVSDLKNEITEWLDRQKQENEILRRKLGDLLDKTDRFKCVNPFTPFEMRIFSDCPFLGKTTSEMNFWHNTSATVIAIRRGSAMVMSPGPYAEFLEGDVVYFVGDEDCYTRVKHFLYPER